MGIHKFRDTQFTMTPGVLDILEPDEPLIIDPPLIGVDVAPAHVD